jgi:hypothetical protein
MRVGIVEEKQEIMRSGNLPDPPELVLGEDLAGRIRR